MTNWTALFFVVLSTLSTLAKANICPLCANPSVLPKWWDYTIPGDGRTCRDIYLYLGDLSPSNAMCQPTKDIAQELCCSSTPPSDFNGGGGGGSGPQPYTGPVGNEPQCPICGTMEYPGIPNAFIVARYVGEYTCHQLYGRGLNGMTPNFMCGPLQDFSRSICGCGPFNPACRDDPNKCYGQPGYNNPLSPVSQPVQRPVQQPVQRPVQQPIQMPVSQPTNVQPTIFNRKTPPNGGKYSTKLSASRGGAATAALRGGRRGEETEVSELLEDEESQTLEFDFRVVEREEHA